MKLVAFILCTLLCVDWSLQMAEYSGCPPDQIDKSPTLCMKVVCQKQLPGKNQFANITKCDLYKCPQGGGKRLSPDVGAKPWPDCCGNFKCWKVSGPN